MRGIDPPAVQLDRRHDIFIDVQHRHQIEALKDKTDLAPPEDCQRVIREFEDLLSCDLHTAGSRSVQTAHHMRQGRLARRRRCRRSREFALLNAKIDAVQRPHHGIPSAVVLLRSVVFNIRIIIPFQEKMYDREPSPDSYTYLIRRIFLKTFRAAFQFLQD